jgi:16S rRNA (uracil1498-N3)-methyltransferase
MHFFFSNTIDGVCGELNESESLHAIRVLRMQIGHEFLCANGKGTIYQCEVSEIKGKKLAFNVVYEIADLSKRNYTLHMAVAPTTNIDRFEWFLEKACELGIDEITPLICQNSERTKVNTERLERVLLAAAKQSMKSTLPKLNEVIRFKEFIETKGHPQTFIAHCKQGEKNYLYQAYNGGNTTLCIGPEGDFTLEEIALAENKGFKSISLGASRLRTETAAISACNIIHIWNETQSDSV